MSFTNLITNAIDTVVDDLRAKGEPSVCELGNQRIKNNKSRAVMFNRLNIHNQTITSTKDFFLALGFKEYVAIDVNTEKDAIAMDLNTDISKQYNYTTV